MCEYCYRKIALCTSNCNDDPKKGKLERYGNKSQWKNMKMTEVKDWHKIILG